MMKRKFATLSFLVLSCVLVSAQDVNTAHDHDFNFSQFRTFAVKLGTSWGDPSAEAAAKQSITRQLEEKGWRQVDPAECDALVVVHGSQQKETIRGFYDDSPGFGWHNVGAPGLADTTEYDYKPGTLMVDIFDAKTKHAVFRGVAKNELTGNAGNEAHSIDKAIKKMLKGLPSVKNNENKTGKQG